MFNLVKNKNGARSAITFEIAFERLKQLSPAKK